MRTGKVTAKKTLMRQLSPIIPSPVKVTKSIINNENIENQTTSNDVEKTLESSSKNFNETQTDMNPISIILSNGQPLLTNFEEKYLLDLMLKSSNQDIESILQEKIRFILQMNYGSQSSLFTSNPSWIFDFILKHFQTLSNHINSTELFEKILNKSFDKNNTTIAFKHWQLKTLVDEHHKQQQQQQPTTSHKRRMTVRRIDFN